MAAPKGNKFWLARSKHGRNKKYETEKELWDAACEYFEWVEANPLFEEKAFHFQGQVIREPIAKMRAMTIQGLCFFLGISDEGLRKYEQHEDFVGIVREIKHVIYNQKFSGAAADLLNANIIARDLGLSDKQDLKADVKADVKAEVSVSLTTDQKKLLNKMLDDEY